MSKAAAITKTQAVIIIAIVAVAGVAGIGYYIISQAPPPPRDKVVIGWAHGISGFLKDQVATLHIYYKWIIEDYNAKGGLYLPEYGRRFNITYIEYDDTSNIPTMLTLTEKLITVDKVDLLFAPCSTAFCFAAFPLYEKYKYPVVALSFGSDLAGAKMLSGEWQYSYSVLGFPGETGNQTAQLFKYINTTTAPGQLNKVGIIYHSDQHGAEYSGAIATYLLMNGFTVVTQSYPPATTDFSTLVDWFEAQAVDVAMLCGYEGNYFIDECITQNYQPKLLFFGPIMETPFLVYNVFGFTKAEVNGTCYYDGWPSTAYKTGALATWAQAHYNRTLVMGGWWPFPASATLYAGLDCLFKAVEKVGLNREAIKNSLRTDTFDTIVGATRIRPGYSMQCELAGTITQWQGRDMMDVIWPLSVASGPILYPKPLFP